jgi:hypothetical protein
VGCISFCGAEDISLYIYMYRFAMEIADWKTPEVKISIADKGPPIQYSTDSHGITWICCGFTHLMSNQWEGGCLIGLSSDWANIQPSSPCEHTVPMSGMIKMALGLLKVTMGFTTWLDGHLKKHPKDCVTVSIPNVSGNWDLPSDIRMNIKPQFYSNMVNVSLKIVLWFSL